MNTPAGSENSYRGVYRSTRVPPCVLRRDDVLRLYEELEEKGREGLEQHLARITPTTPAQYDELEHVKNEARKGYRLTLFIYGADGDQIAVASRGDLLSQRLPDQIRTVIYDSALTLRTVHKFEPENRFRLTLDFTEPPGFDQYDPTSSPTPNTSNLEITGRSGTWVTGTHESISRYLRQRGTARGWLHTHAAYNLYQWILALPGSLWVVFRASEALEAFFSGVHPALRGAIYIYLFLLAFILARGIAFGFRWIFPLVELEGSRNTRARTILGAGLASLLFALAYDVLRTLVF